MKWSSKIAYAFNHERAPGWITTVFLCVLAANNQNHNGTTCWLWLRAQSHVGPHKPEVTLTLKRKWALKQKGLLGQPGHFRFLKTKYLTHILSLLQTQTAAKLRKGYKLWKVYIPRHLGGHCQIQTIFLIDSLDFSNFFLPGHCSREQRLASIWWNGCLGLLYSS